MQKGLEKRKHNLEAKLEKVEHAIKSRTDDVVDFKQMGKMCIRDRAIREGLRNLEAGDKYDNLYLAAKARSESDWLVAVSYTHLDPLWYYCRCRSDGELAAISGVYHTYFMYCLYYTRSSSTRSSRPCRANATRDRSSTC